MVQGKQNGRKQRKLNTLLSNAMQRAHKPKPLAGPWPGVIDMPMASSQLRATSSAKGENTQIHLSLNVNHYLN